MTSARNTLVTAGVALAIAVMACVAYADTSPTRPVSQCTNFACEN